KIPLVTVIIAGLFSASAIAYNSLTEARLRSIPIQEVTIIKSAMDRLGLKLEPNENVSKSAKLTNVVPKLINRYIYNLIPFVFKKTEPQSNNIIGVLYLTSFLLIFFYFLKTTKIIF